MEAAAVSSYSVKSRWYTCSRPSRQPRRTATYCGPAHTAARPRCTRSCSSYRVTSIPDPAASSAPSPCSWAACTTSYCGKRTPSARSGTGGHPAILACSPACSRTSHGPPARWRASPGRRRRSLVRTPCACSVGTACSSAALTGRTVHRPASRRTLVPISPCRTLTCTRPTCSLLTPAHVHNINALITMVDVCAKWHV